ncbi:hypothetical protein D3C85_1644190 [compost metagenome]
MPRGQDRARADQNAGALDLAFDPDHAAEGVQASKKGAQFYGIEHRRVFIDILRWRRTLYEQDAPRP